MLSNPPRAATPEQALQRYLGGSEFRPGQREAIEHLLSDRDVLAIMPTGGGKSVIYQAVALLRPGTVIVVSPLIALMCDQVQRLTELGYPGAAALHSAVSAADQRAMLAALASGRLRLLYVTPERCLQEAFLAAARAGAISLFAVDEAHCISQWGHDFRSAYLGLDEAAEAMGRPVMAALTATATPPVREDIIGRLRLRRPALVFAGFDRPNLFYEVYPVSDDSEKRRVLHRLLAEPDPVYAGASGAELHRAVAGSGLVYAARTATARSLSQSLNRAGVHTAYYHGQLKPSQRNAVHERFREGAVRTVVATNAFGMGIDRADLRFVVHFDSPPAPESYYQESGRAGRDGALARAALIAFADDLGRTAFAAGSGGVAAGDVEAVATACRAGPPTGLSIGALAASTDLSAARLARTVDLLVAGGCLYQRRRRVRVRTLEPDCLAAALEIEAQRQRHDRSRLDMMRAYITTEGCRRQFLLQYFGDFAAPADCGMCDRCVPRIGLPRRHSSACAAAAGAYVPGAAVEHRSWGQGTVQRVEGDRLLVHFPTSGYRTLDAPTVEEQGLLRPSAGA